MAADPKLLRRGIYRVGGVGGLEAWAQVEDVNGGTSMPLDESLYRQRGYRPDFEHLPTQEEYNAS